MKTARPKAPERYRDGDLRKRALTAPDAALADVLLHPDFGYWVSLTERLPPPRHRRRLHRHAGRSAGAAGAARGLKTGGVARSGRGRDALRQLPQRAPVRQRQAVGIGAIGRGAECGFAQLRRAVAPAGSARLQRACRRTLRPSAPTSSAVSSRRSWRAGRTPGGSGAVHSGAPSRLARSLPQQAWHGVTQGFGPACAAQRLQAGPALRHQQGVAVQVAGQRHRRHQLPAGASRRARRGGRIRQLVRHAPTAPAAAGWHTRPAAARTQARAPGGSGAADRPGRGSDRQAHGVVGSGEVGGACGALGHQGVARPRSKASGWRSSSSPSSRSARAARATSCRARSAFRRRAESSAAASRSVTAAWPSAARGALHLGQGRWRGLRQALRQRLRLRCRSAHLLRRRAHLAGGLGHRRRQLGQRAARVGQRGLGAARQRRRCCCSRLCQLLQLGARHRRCAAAAGVPRGPPSSCRAEPATAARSRPICARSSPSSCACKVCRRVASVGMASGVPAGAWRRHGAARHQVQVDIQQAGEQALGGQAGHQAALHQHRQGRPVGRRIGAQQVAQHGAVEGGRHRHRQPAAGPPAPGPRR
jgi:hypothetical protein